MSLTSLSKQFGYNEYLLQPADGITVMRISTNVMKFLPCRE